MSDRQNGPSSKVYALSCTDYEWEEVRERANRRGTSISRYMVERALAVHPMRDSSSRLVLDEDEQREIYDRVAVIAERTLAGTDSPETVIGSLRNAIGFLVDEKMLDMVRSGRAGELGSILENLFGEEEAASILRRFHARMKRRGLLA